MSGLFALLMQVVNACNIALRSAAIRLLGLCMLML
jgi:hypothetical protein